LQRRVDGKAATLDSGLGREVCEPLELGNELRPAIGIARIIERVDADEQVARPARLGEAEREAQKDRVARGDISDRNPLTHSALWNLNVAGQRRSPECAQIKRQDD